MSIYFQFDALRSNWCNNTLFSPCQVFERDNYTCQCCGSRSSKNNPIKINAHHINNYYSDIDNRYNIDNGITLCEKCHKKFHKEYGNKNNNKKQISKFIKDNTEVN